MSSFLEQPVESTGVLSPYDAGFLLGRCLTATLPQLDVEFAVALTGLCEPDPCCSAHLHRSVVTTVAAAHFPQDRRHLTGRAYLYDHPLTPATFTDDDVTAATFQSLTQTYPEGFTSRLADCIIETFVADTLIHDAVAHRYIDWHTAYVRAG